LLRHLLGGASCNPTTIAEPDDRERDCSANSTQTHGLQVWRDLHDDVFLIGGLNRPQRDCSISQQGRQTLKFARDDGFAASRVEWQDETIAFNLADFGR
jgi:hypothetical protein